MTLRLGRIRLPATYLFGLLTAVLVVIGSTSPWLRTTGELFNGDIEVTHVIGISGDGQATLAMGIFAGVLILWKVLRRRSSGIGLAAVILVLAIAGLVGVFNWSELHRIPRIEGQTWSYFQFYYQAGWGLIVVTCAGFAGAIAMAYQMWNDSYR